MTTKDFHFTASLSEDDFEMIAERVVERLAPHLVAIQVPGTAQQEQPVSKKEACRYYNCSEPTMGKHMASGRVPFHRNGRRVYFFLSELREALTKNKKA